MIYSHFSSYFCTLFERLSGNGMPMMGYGGYSQTMETPNTYGGGSYGSMGMMNANNFSGTGGMTS